MHTTPAMQAGSSPSVPPATEQSSTAQSMTAALLIASFTADDRVGKTPCMIRFKPSAKEPFRVPPINSSACSGSAP